MCHAFLAAHIHTHKRAHARTHARTHVTCSVICIKQDAATHTYLAGSINWSDYSMYHNKIIQHEYEDSLPPYLPIPLLV